MWCLFEWTTAIGRSGSGFGEWSWYISAAWWTFCFIYWSILRGNLLNFKKKSRIHEDLLIVRVLIVMRSVQEHFIHIETASLSAKDWKNLGLCLVVMAIEHRDLYLARSDGTTFLYPGISITTLLLIIEKTWNLTMLMFL